MKSCLWPEGPGKLSSGLDGTKLTGIWNASSSRRGREGSARGFNPISANLLDLGTPTSSPLQPMAETRTRTRTRTSTIEERLRARRNEPRRGRGFLSLGPPESFSFFDRTRTRTPHEHLEDLPGNEELVKIKILTLCALFAECSCRTQESPRLSRILVLVLLLVLEICHRL